MMGAFVLPAGVPCALCGRSEEPQDALNLVSRLQASALFDIQVGAFMNGFQLDSLLSSSMILCVDIGTCC